MRVTFGRPSRRGFFDTITSKLLVVNVFIFLLTTFSDSIFSLLALTPNLAVEGMFWQFFTYMYVHGGLAHIFFNMFALLMFGPTIEEMIGSKKYFVFYTLCGLGSGLLHILINGVGSIPLVGASGAIFGVVTAYGLMFPKNIIYVYFVPMPAIVAIGLFAGISILFGISGVQGGIAHFGHIGGMLVAFLLIKFFGFGRKQVVYFWDDY